MGILQTYSALERLALTDFAEHVRWQSVSTFPKHFHDGSEDNVRESFISDDPALALAEFLTFARQKLQAGE